MHFVSEARVSLSAPADDALCGDDTGDCRSHNAAAFTGAITGDKNAFYVCFQIAVSRKMCVKKLYFRRG
jgi:hypothetical protein